MNPFIALILGAVMGGVLASGGEPKKEETAQKRTKMKSLTKEPKKWF